MQIRKKEFSIISLLYVTTSLCSFQFDIDVNAWRVIGERESLNSFLTELEYIPNQKRYFLKQKKRY